MHNVCVVTSVIFNNYWIALICVDWQVTMSTVGFGDISAVTVFGRVFMMIFISIGLVCKIWKIKWACLRLPYRNWEWIIYWDSFSVNVQSFVCRNSCKFSYKNPLQTHLENAKK